MSYIDPLGLELIATSLPGIGNSYLDSAFSPMVDQFIEIARARGVGIVVNSAYRSPARQAALQRDPNAITPADTSLHSCGVAIDINYSSLRNIPNGLTGDQQRQIIRETASEAGLSWGGNFRTPDPPHFFFDPGGDRRQRVLDAAVDYRRLTNQ